MLMIVIKFIELKGIKMFKRKVVERVGSGYYCKIASGTGHKIVVFNPSKHIDLVSVRG
jgi:hypothetical protein